MRVPPEMLRCLLLLLSAAAGAAKGCTAVQPAQCGTDWWDSCLKCGPKSDYDCEKCCPGCKPVVKAPNTYCDCSGPPAPPPGSDTWSNYKVAGMEVIAVTGGKNESYEKAVIMLHGGGGSGQDYVYNYNQGWMGNLSGLKYVFPTSAYPSHVWFHTYKRAGCGLADDCAYNVTSIREAASWVATLIEHEADLLGGDHAKIYLSGFSEGGQLTGYMQLAKLKYALGGTIIMDSFPLPPLFDWKDAATAKKSATYSGDDMAWMIWHGEADPIFPVNMTMTAWNDILNVLGVKSDVLKIEHTEPGMTHTLVKPEFDDLVQFVRGL